MDPQFDYISIPIYQHQTYQNLVEYNILNEGVYNKQSS